MSQQHTARASVIASLYHEALCQGQSLRFQVVSNSMSPVLCAGDTVYIEPVKANELRVGDIAAFETPGGMMIHRIVRCKQTQDRIRLLQMSDVELHPSWVEEQAVAGRVVKVQRRTRQADLRHPIARWSGMVTARIRYRLYRCNPSSKIVHSVSRLVVHLGYWCMRCWCTSKAKEL